MKPAVIIRSDKSRDGAPAIELAGPPFASGFMLAPRDLRRFAVWLQAAAEAADGMQTQVADWHDQMLEFPPGLPDSSCPNCRTEA